MSNINYYPQYRLDRPSVVYLKCIGTGSNQSVFPCMPMCPCVSVYRPSTMRLYVIVCTMYIAFSKVYVVVHRFYCQYFTSTRLCIIVQHDRQQESAAPNVFIIYQRDPENTAWQLTTDTRKHFRLLYPSLFISISFSFLSRSFILFSTFLISYASFFAFDHGLFYQSISCVRR